MASPRYPLLLLTLALYTHTALQGEKKKRSKIETEPKNPKTEPEKIVIDKKQKITGIAEAKNIYVVGARILNIKKKNWYKRSRWLENIHLLIIIRDSR